MSCFNQVNPQTLISRFRCVWLAMEQNWYRWTTDTTFWKPLRVFYLHAHLQVILLITEISTLRRWNLKADLKSFYWSVSIEVTKPFGQDAPWLGLGHLAWPSCVHAEAVIAHNHRSVLTSSPSWSSACGLPWEHAAKSTRGEEMTHWPRSYPVCLFKELLSINHTRERWSSVSLTVTLFHHFNHI